jgi:hypothetical protein
MAWSDDVAYDLRHEDRAYRHVENGFSHNSVEDHTRREKTSLSLQQLEHGNTDSLFDQWSVLLNPGFQEYHYDLLTVWRAESGSLVPPRLHGRYRLAGRLQGVHGQ